VPRTRLRDEDIVLDPNASESGDVDPRFVREDHVRAKHEIARGVQGAAVVDREADRMTEPVDEPSLVLRPVDQVPGGRVDRLPLPSHQTGRTAASPRKILWRCRTPAGSARFPPDPSRAGSS